MDKQTTNGVSSWGRWKRSAFSSKSLDSLGTSLTSKHLKTCTKIIENLFCEQKASLPKDSMYGIFTYIWFIFMVNVGKYTIHWVFGLWKGTHGLYCFRDDACSSARTAKPARVFPLHVWKGCIFWGLKGKPTSQKMAEEEILVGEPFLHRFDGLSRDNFLIWTKTLTSNIPSPHCRRNEVKGWYWKPFFLNIILPLGVISLKVSAIFGGLLTCQPEVVILLPAVVSRWTSNTTPWNLAMQAYPWRVLLVPGQKKRWSRNVKHPWI